MVLLGVGQTGRAVRGAVAELANVDGQGWFTLGCDQEKRKTLFIIIINHN